MTLVDESGTKAECWVLTGRTSESVIVQEVKLTEGIDGINRKEKTGETDSPDDSKPAVHVVGLLDGNIIQGRKHILSAESLGGADCRHDFLCERSTFGNMLE